MHEIRTQVDIAAGAALVWSVLTDFARYPSWNPTIRGVEGPFERGGTIRIAERMAVAKPGGAPKHNQPTTTRTTGTLGHIREPRQLTWFSPLGWLLGSERRFSIESLPDGSVRFHQDERIDGLLAPFAWRRLLREREPAFERMNRALKSRAERAAAGAPATVG
jgi:hypothetical protein